MPADINDKLTFGSSVGDRLIDESILFHWEGDGWAVGTIKSRNLNPELMHKTRRKTKERVNFSVHYPVDDAEEEHVLSKLDYATTAKAPTGSWCLLGPDERPLAQSEMPERFSRGRGRGGEQNGC